jgi:hypothetical protein
MRKLEFLEDYFKAIKIQVFFVMVPFLVISFLYVIVIRIRGQYANFPYFNEFVLFLIFIAGLRSGYEFRKKPIWYYSIGMFFLIIYLFVVLLYSESVWNTHQLNDIALQHLALGIMRFLGMIFAAGFGGCLLGKWIAGLKTAK